MSHDHGVQTNNYNRSFAIGIALNIIFVVIEVTYGILADSLALIADAGHNLSDVVSLVLAWGAYYLSKKNPTKNKTYGLKKITIMASLLSSILLYVALGAIAWESFERLSSPAPVNGMVVIVVAGIGVVINTITALLFAKGQEHDLNIKAAYLHMAADAAVSVGVVIAGIAIMMTGWLWLDPVISLVIVAIILIGTWSLFRDSWNLSLDSVPEGIDINEVETYLLSLSNITEIHDLHIWAISTTENALTVHLVTTDALIYNHLLDEIQEYLMHEFNIVHSTIQIEKDEKEYHCILDKSV